MKQISLMFDEKDGRELMDKTIIDREPKVEMSNGKEKPKNVYER